MSFLAVDEGKDQLLINIGDLSIVISVQMASAFSAITLLISSIQRLLDPFRKHTKSRVQQMVIWIQISSFLSHLFTSLNVLPPIYNAYGRKVYPMRFVQSSLNFPLVMMAIEESSVLNDGKLGSLHFQNIALFVSAVTNVFIPEEFKEIGSLLSLLGLSVWYYLCNSVIRTYRHLQRVKETSQTVTTINMAEKLQRTLKLQVTMVLITFIYTTVMSLGNAKLISTVNESILLCIGDVISNALFVAVISYNDSLNGTEMRRVKENQTARNQFLRYIFHEMRVPLNSLTLGIDVLKRDMQDVDEYSDFKEVTVGFEEKN
jgi:hypothetical protein